MNFTSLLNKLMEGLVIYFKTIIFLALASRVEKKRRRIVNFQPDKIAGSHNTIKTLVSKNIFIPTQPIIQLTPTIQQRNLYKKVQHQFQFKMRIFIKPKNKRMKTISFKTFNVIAIVILMLLTAFIFSILFSSCEKSDVATTTTTLRTKEIILNSASGNLQKGTAVFAENADHSFNIKTTLQNAIKDTVMVMRINNGSIVSPGTIAIPLTLITSTGGEATGATLNITTAIPPTGTIVPVTYFTIISYSG